MIKSQMIFKKRKNPLEENTNVNEPETVMPGPNDRSTTRPNLLQTKPRSNWSVSKIGNVDMLNKQFYVGKT